MATRHRDWKDNRRKRNPVPIPLEQQNHCSAGRGQLRREHKHEASPCNRALSLFFYYIGSAEGHEYPDLQVGDEVNPRPFLGSNPWSNGKFFQSVGNVTVDTIKHYKDSQMKPNAELQLCGPRGF